MEPGEFWAIGDYATIGDLWSAPGRHLAAVLDVAGHDVIDLATGTGVTAIAMAQQGARSVMGVDATPSLLAEAARRADAADVAVDWIEADFSAVPLPDDAADLVVSTFGLIFAADPAAALAECRRLTRPGGRIVFTSWSVTGLFGRLRTTLRPFMPAAPDPWHETADSIRAVAGADATVVERSFAFEVPSPDAFVAQLERDSAPFVVAAEALADQWPAARAALVETVTGAGTVDDDGYRADVEYLVTTLTAH